MPKPAQKIHQLRGKLLRWFRRERRDLPWRRRPTLYRVLVSEFMLQQTRVEQALPYYRRFVRAFPSMKKLAEAPLGEVIKLWEGLGYYARARNLQRTAQRLAGRKKPGLAELAACPGIGPYTLAALASIVWQHPSAVVDGNVRRVLARTLALSVPPECPSGQAAIRARAEAWLAPRAPGDWNQALMELGATLCRPRRPRCPACPLKGGCRAKALGRPEDFPVRLKKPPRPHRQIAAALIRRKDRRILIAQRPPTGLLPHLWEFPGGKQEAGESLEACCAREVREELGIEVQVGARIAEVQHAYSHFSITLHCFACRYVKGRPKALGCQDWKWVRPEELARYPFPRANRVILEKIAKEMK